MAKLAGIALLATALATLGTVAQTATTSPIGIFPAVEVVTPFIGIGFSIMLPAPFLTLTWNPIVPWINLTIGSNTTGVFWATGITATLTPDSPATYSPWIGVGLFAYSSMYGIIRIDYTGTPTAALGIVFRF